MLEAARAFLAHWSGEASWLGVVLSSLAFYNAWRAKSLLLKQARDFKLMGRYQELAETLGRRLDDLDRFLADVAAEPRAGIDYARRLRSAVQSVAVAYHNDFRHGDMKAISFEALVERFPSAFPADGDALRQRLQEAFGLGLDAQEQLKTVIALRGGTQ